MTDRTHPDSGRIILLHDAKTALMYEELRAAIDDGHESMSHADALAEIAAIRAENVELRAQLEAVGAGGVQALSAAPEAIAKLRHLYQNMVNGAVRDTASAKRIAEGLLAPAIEALERATPPAEQPPRWVERWHGSGGKEFWEGWSILNAANREMIAHLGPVDPGVVRSIVTAHNDALCGECAGTGGRWCPACAGTSATAEQQARYSRLHDADALHGQQLNVYGTATTTEAVTPEGGATTEAALGAEQAAPKAETGAGNSGFDHKTAADLLNNKTVSDEAVRKFVAASRWAHDERAALSATLLAMHGVLTSREAEIALLKKALLEAEAAPQQEVQEPTEIPEEIERMAADRYKVVPSHESMFHRWAVVAGTGTQQLYLGREVECQNMARKFAGAFLDGAFVAMQQAAPQPAPAPLSECLRLLNSFEYEGDGGYCKENCRWVTQKVQARNKRRGDHVAGISVLPSGNYRVLINTDTQTNKHVGIYKTYEEAREARLNAEKQYWNTERKEDENDEEA